MYFKKNPQMIPLSKSPALLHTHTQRNLLQEAPTGQIKQNYGMNIKDSDGFRCIE